MDVEPQHLGLLGIMLVIQLGEFERPLEAYYILMILHQRDLPYCLLGGEYGVRGVESVLAAIKICVKAGKGKQLADIIRVRQAGYHGICM